MAGIDLGKCLAEISPDAPSGEDLAYDAEYTALFQMAKGKAETQWSAAEEPNWREVRDACGKLLTKTKDVPLTVLLSVALLETQGLSGLADGLELLRDLLGQYWPSIYPMLDPDDGDPTERVNAVNALSPSGGSVADDVYRVGQRVRGTPLAVSARLGRFSWKDIAIATGQLPRPTGDDAAAVDGRTVTAALDDTPVDLLQAASAALARAAAACRDIEVLVDGYVGGGNGANLNDLRKTLVDVATTTDAQLAKRGIKTAGGATTAAATGGGAVAAAVATSTGAGAGPAGAPGEVRSRQDVAAAIDRICAYYAEHEPSSPIPLLLLRARRLVAKSFADIVRDLSPDALAALSVISGTDLTADATAEAEA